MEVAAGRQMRCFRAESTEQKVLGEGLLVLARAQVFSKFLLKEFCLVAEFQQHERQPEGANVCHYSSHNL